MFSRARRWLPIPRVSHLVRWETLGTMLGCQLQIFSCLEPVVCFPHFFLLKIEIFALQKAFFKYYKTLTTLITLCKSILQYWHYMKQIWYLYQEPIKGSLHLSYLALASTLSRVDLLIERFPQFEEPIKTELWQSLFYLHAHDHAGDSEERLDDSSDGSSDTVDVSSSEYSASSDSESEKEKLASQKTDCDGRERGTCKTKRCHDYEDLTTSRKKAKLTIFFYYLRFTQQKYDTCRGKKSFLKYIRSTRERVDSRNEWKQRIPLMASCLY